MKNTYYLCLTLLLFSCTAKSEQEQKKVDKELHYYEANNLEETEPHSVNENIILVGEETSSILENISPDTRDFEVGYINKTNAQFSMYSPTCKWCV